MYSAIVDSYEYSLPVLLILTFVLFQLYSAPTYAYPLVSNIVKTNRAFCTTQVSDSDYKH